MSTCEYDGKFLKVTKRNDWEFVERTNATGIVGIIPITDDNKLVLIKQFLRVIRAEQRLWLFLIYLYLPLSLLEILRLFFEVVHGTEVQPEAQVEKNP